ncbi:MAG: UDP-N-acetylmuramate--L-alanine ligase [bacterium]
MLKGVRSIHFIGIGGIGMSGLAQVLLQMGYLISGSDKRKNNLTQKLQALGATIYQGHDSSYLKGVDLVVFSSIIPADNPELLEAKRKEIPAISRGKLLGYLVREKESIVVAGTHGKTTTTSLISSILRQAGKNPTMFIGGEFNEIKSNSQLGGDRYVVVESDESDGSFLCFLPKICVLTSLEDDHLDYYGSKNKLVEAFIQFTHNLKAGGTLIVNRDDLWLKQVLRRISLHYSQRLISYGIDSEGDVVANKVRLDEFTSSYEVRYRGEEPERITVSLPGLYNVYNSLAAITAGRSMGIRWDQIKMSLSFFQGVKRRFELVGQTGSGALLIDDYAHHPTEIEEVLKTAKRIRPRIIVVFQPHRYSRTKTLLSKFARCFDEADILLLTKIYSAGESPIPRVSGRLLFDEVKQHRAKPTYYFSAPQQILDFLRKAVRKNDLILTIGAGDVWKVGKRFLGEPN